MSCIASTIWYALCSLPSLQFRNSSLCSVDPLACLVDWVVCSSFLSFSQVAPGILFGAFDLLRAQIGFSCKQFVLCSLQLRVCRARGLDEGLSERCLSRPLACLRFDHVLKLFDAPISIIDHALDLPGRVFGATLLTFSCIPTGHDFSLVRSRSMQSVRCGQFGGSGTFKVRQKVAVCLYHLWN